MNILTCYKPTESQAKFKSISVNQLANRGHVVPGVIALLLRVANKKTVGVIDRYEAEFLREKFATEFYRGGDDGLLARAVLRIAQCLLYHAAQKFRRHELAM